MNNDYTTIPVTGPVDPSNWGNPVIVPFPQTFPYPFDWDTTGPKKLVLPLTDEEITKLRDLLKEVEKEKFNA